MKKVLAIVLVLVMSMSLFGCGAKTEGTETPEVQTPQQDEEETESVDSAGGQEKIRIGWATYGLSNPVWANMLNYAVDWSKDKGIELTYVDGGDDPAKQVSQVENFVQSNVDAIILQAIDPNSLADVAAEAVEKGIYVVDFNRAVENCSVHLSADLEYGGRQLAQMTAEWVNEVYPDEPIKVGLLDIQTVEIGIIESKACQEEFAKLCPNAEIVSVLSTLTLEEGVGNTEAMMNAHPDIKVIMCCSAGAGVGANTVLTSLKDESEWDKIGLFGFDATEEECLAIKNGIMKGTISPGTSIEHAEILLTMALDLIEGKGAEDQSLPFFAVTAENVDQYLADAYGYEE